MHDIDRALFEVSDEGGTYGEYTGETYGETYGEDESYGAAETYGVQAQDRESEDELLGEWGAFGENETYGEVDGRELALAAELLAVNSEEELDRFLGSLIGGAVSAARNFASSDAGRAVGRILKDSAQRALPQIGRAVGSYLAPGRGGDVGHRLGQAAAASFEADLQTEGLSAEDRELQNARAFIRYARAAARNTASTSRRVPPAAAARRAAIQAAQQYLPGLLRPPTAATPTGGSSTTTPAGSPTSDRSQGGRWVRRGRNIVLFGAG
ncbi:hypothetical protein [Rhodococcus aetherivorans]